MKALKYLLVIVFIIAAGGCSSAQSKATAQYFDTQWAPKGKTIKSEKFVKVKQWTAGQYTITGESENGKKQSVSRFLLVGKDAQGWIYESVTTNINGKTTGMQMLVSGFDKAMATGDTSDIKIVWMKIMDEKGNVQFIQDTISIGFMQKMYSSSWEKIAQVAVNMVDGGTISVPAGTFEGTSLVKSTAKVFGKTYNQSTWFHPDIPVNGVVKSMSEDGKYTSELLDFGFDGKPTIK